MTSASGAARAIVVVAAAAGLAIPGQASSAAKGGPYWLGTSYRGLPLAATLEDTYIYGTCKAGDDSGCSPPYEVQHHPLCERNPLSLDNPGRRRVFRVRGGAIAVADEDGIDVGIGRHSVTVFAHSRARAGRAVHLLRRRSESAPSGPLPAPVYPKVVLQELKRVATVRRRVRTVKAVARRIGITNGEARVRLRMATLLGPEALAAVPASTRTWAEVRDERRIALFAQAIGRHATAERFGLSQAQLRGIVLRSRGISGRC